MVNLEIVCAYSIYSHINILLKEGTSMPKIIMDDGRILTGEIIDFDETQDEIDALLKDTDELLEDGADE